MGVIEAGFEVAAAVLLAILGWAVFVYFFPDRACRWCEMFASLHLRCRRCGGTRRTWRLAARHVHRVRLSLQRARDERGAP